MRNLSCATVKESGRSCSVNRFGAGSEGQRMCTVIEREVLSVSGDITDLLVVAICVGRRIGRDVVAR